MHTGAAAATRSSTAVRRKVCVPPPGRSGAADAVAVDLGETLQEVEGADAVPQLHSDCVDPPERVVRMAPQKGGTVRRTPGAERMPHLA